MPKITHEEIYRIKGRPIAKFYEVNPINIKLIEFLSTPIAINKNELIELIDWLIKKSEEM